MVPPKSLHIHSSNLQADNYARKNHASTQVGSLTVPGFDVSMRNFLNVSEPQKIVDNFEGERILQL